MNLAVKLLLLVYAIVMFILRWVRPPRSERANNIMVLTVGAILWLAYTAPSSSRACPSTSDNVTFIIGFAFLAVAYLLPFTWLLLRRSFSVETRVVYAVFIVSTLIEWFSLAHWQVSRVNPCAYSEHLSRIDAFYFALTTTSTVGFGDIHPLSAGARLLVSGQIVVGMSVIAVLLAVIYDSVRSRRV